MCEILNTYNPLLTSETLGRLNASYEIRFALDRMLKNINLINRGINSKLINISNTTLYRVAADEYDDAPLWTYLADVNQMVDPVVTAARTLIVPNRPPNTAGFGV
jgi:hypothetical protein